MCVNSPEYLEAFFARAEARLRPVNVNYRYVGAELAFLLDNSDTRRARVPRRLRRDRRRRARDAARRPPAARAAPGRAHGRRRPARRRARLRSTRSPPSTDADRRPTREPSGDDLVFLYTGGTTGYPKAVMWRSDDLYVSLWQMARPGTEPPDVATVDHAPASRRRRCCPRARSCTAPGSSSRCRRSSGGGTVVLLDTPRLDADAVWSAIEREHVQVCTIVGDAFARPLLAALDADARPLGPLGAARDHVVGRHVEPGDEARPARAPARTSR